LRGSTHPLLVLLLAPLMLVVFAVQAFVAVWTEPALDALGAEELAGWVAEHCPASTVENLSFGTERVAAADWIVVTDDLHAPRTRFAAERLGLEVEVVGVRTVRGRSNYALREVLGLLAYRLGALG
jgi:uncharacterized SAM-binding protein YcdF (DUF218 family)